jgi:membrane-bound lytic murein transglycosylase D
MWTRYCATVSKTSLNTKRSVQNDRLYLTPNAPEESLFLDSRRSWPDIWQGGRFEVPDNDLVERYVNKLEHAPSHRSFQKSLERSWRYVPAMKEILMSQGVPPDLVYVVMVESRFQTDALSPRAAMGFWQFVPSTARHLDLQVNGRVDERRDPLKSTRAAARYLNALYDRFGDWSLALAAYNCGETLLQNTMDRTGANDFWTLARRGLLPAETRAYVPKVFAAIRISRNLEKYGFEEPKILPVYVPESVRVRRGLRLEQVAQWAETSVQSLRNLNPSLKTDRLPEEEFVLHLPPRSG